MKVLITGASSGIGLEIAKIYYKRGYKLYLVARNTEKLYEIFPKAEIISMDLSVAKNCIKLYIKVGLVDILINNAGFGAFGAFWQTSINNELNMIKLNIVAYHILTKLYVGDMYKANKGTIMNVASLAAYSYGPFMSTYYGTKAYVQRLSASVDYELYKSGSRVRVLSICPGPVKTEFNKRAGVKFSVREKSAKFVARSAVNAIDKGKRITCPGIMDKLTAFSTRFAPTELLLEIGYRIQKSKK